MKVQRSNNAVPLHHCMFSRLREGSMPDRARTGVYTRTPFACEGAISVAELRVSAELGSGTGMGQLRHSRMETQSGDLRSLILLCWASRTRSRMVELSPSVVGR